MTNAVEIRGLGKRYWLGEGTAGSLRDTVAARMHRARRSEIWALHDVDLTIGQGDVVGIIGRNGAGKSTLLKILCRVTLPSRGAVTLRGRVGALLEVGTGFHPELTGRENVFLNGTILGMGRHEVRRRFDEIVAFSGVDAFLDTPIKRYSSGMQLRLAFAVAAHLEPEIMIVDEVLAVGDADFQRRCLGRMDELAREGRTVVFVSHDTGAVAPLCTRAVWLTAGTISGDGPVRETIDGYWRSLDLTAGPTQTADVRAGAVEVSRVSLTEDGRPVGDGLVRGATLTARVRLFAHERLTGVDVAFYVMDRAGTRILDEALSDVSQEVPSLETGEHEVSLTLPPLLPVGAYTLGLWVSAIDQPTLDEPVLHFDVRPSPEDTTENVTRQRLVQPSAVRWQVKGVDP